MTRSATIPEGRRPVVDDFPDHHAPSTSRFDHWETEMDAGDGKDDSIPDRLSSQPSPPHIPDELLDVIALKFRMLADPTRLAILRCLMRGERNVTQIVRETGRNQANVSKHLKMLADSGLAGRRKDGLQVFYRIDDPLVERLCRLVCTTVIEEMRSEVARRSELLDNWVI